ncbi:SCO family protein [Streptomyces sodiiphilus]|uniref:SCO family protein n=1 Tax=Streptomyces sodiiphilus TaxID=226217 RepID=A0ABP5B2S7_9ACTN
MHIRNIRTGLLAVAAALALAACGSDGHTDHQNHGADAAEVSGGTSADRGTVLDQPFDKPDITLTGTDGEPYDLVAETAGHPTLLYFGYTNCPDVCPLTMSNIAVAADSLTQEQREALRVVFITSDPERDTPESLGPWLKAQAPDFIGLTGDFEEIQAAARSVGVHIDAPYEDDNGGIVSTHGSSLLAFLPGDDKGHVLYTEDTPVETYEADLPKIIAGETP